MEDFEVHDMADPSSVSDEVAHFDSRHVESSIDDSELSDPNAEEGVVSSPASRAVSSHRHFVAESLAESAEGSELGIDHENSETESEDDTHNVRNVAGSSNKAPPRQQSINRLSQAH